MLFDQQQSLVKIEARAEHEAAQAASERIAISNLCRFLDQLGQIVDVDGA